MPIAVRRTTKTGVRHASMDTTKPTIPVRSKRLCTIAKRMLGRKETRILQEPRSNPVLDSRKVAALDESNEFVTFGIRQPDGIFAFPDCDSLGSDHDLGAFGANRAKSEFDRGHLGPPLDPTRRHPTIC